MDLLDANFCFESCRGRGRGIDTLVCKGCETTWHSVCGKGWGGTCPKCGTDERVEVFEMPAVPMGQVVIKVEREEGGSGIRGGGLQDETWRPSEEAQGRDTRHRHRVA